MDLSDRPDNVTFNGGPKVRKGEGRKVLVAALKISIRRMVELSFRWRRFHVKESSPLEAIRELG